MELEMLLMMEDGANGEYKSNRLFRFLELLEAIECTENSNFSP